MTAAGAAAGIVVDYNLQNQITRNQEVDDILMRSVEEWLTAEDWHVLFENRDLFMPINQALIPVETAGLFRADWTHNCDRNDWRIMSPKQTIRNELGDLRFNVDFEEGLWVEAGKNGKEIVLRRQVVRNQGLYKTATFIHYRYGELN